MVKLKQLNFQIRIRHFIFWKNCERHKYVEHFTPPYPPKNKPQDEFYSYIRETTLQPNYFLSVSCTATLGSQR
jgi:hypothetical protein